MCCYRCLCRASAWQSAATTRRWSWPSRWRAGRRGLDARSLVRLRDTLAQRTLKRAERLANVKGAFAVLPECAAAIQNRRVLLVDDVMTSGASLHAAAQALLQAGAHSVTGLVFARTGIEH
jgi:predicted amidophosphoribosyltransferase